MKKDEIDDLARQARNIWSESKTTEGMSFFLNTFSKLVEERTAAKEREACAKVAEQHPAYDWSPAVCEITYAIRTRGEA